MSEKEQFAQMESGEVPAIITDLLIETASIRVKIMRIRQYLKTQDGNEYESAIEELDAAIESLYGAEANEGNAYRNYVVAVATVTA